MKIDRDRQIVRIPLTLNWNYGVNRRIEPGEGAGYQLNRVVGLLMGGGGGERAWSSTCKSQ